MSNQQNYKMIDDYLTGKLSPEESGRFMELLEQDPALKEEFLMQKDMVHSLQNHRRAELKNRLNQIEVGTGYSVPSALTLKFIAGTALVAVLGIGTYFALDHSEAEPVKAPVELSIQEPAPKPAATEIPATKEIETPPAAIEQEKENALSKADVAKTENTKPAEEKESPKAIQPKTSTKENKEIKPASEAANTATNAEVVKPEVITFFEEQDPTGGVPLVEAPEDKLKNARKFDSQNIEVSTKTDRRYPFHYMFFENQLNIYGDFSKVPYEVLEVNTGTHATYFLYHNGNYYELNPNQRKITRLKELTNERLIQELEVTRIDKLKR